jgi:hypothetical protein
MNSNFIIIILILIILYLYFFKCENKRYNKTFKINPKEFNPAIHHPACL